MHNSSHGIFIENGEIVSLRFFSSRALAHGPPPRGNPEIVQLCYHVMNMIYVDSTLQFNAFFRCHENLYVHLQKSQSEETILCFHDSQLLWIDRVVYCPKY